MGAPHSPMQHSLHGAHQVHKLRVDLGVTRKHGRDENRDPATANEHIGRSETCPRKRTCSAANLMSALCHKQTSRHATFSRTALLLPRGAQGVFFSRVHVAELKQRLRRLADVRIGRSNRP